MASRARDWMSQAERDLSHAREAQGVGHHEWACFAAHQAAEKALKALFQSLGADARGHSVVGLLEELPPSLRPAAELWDAAGRLDRHYIPTRYPNAFPSGAPYSRYTARDGEEAIRDAERILAFCARHLA